MRPSVASARRARLRRLLRACLPPCLRRVAPAGLLAGLLVALPGGPLLGGPLLRGAQAGPVEAREAWERARRALGRPWRERVRAYRAVRHATHARDPLQLRALAAEARVLREQGRVHAAAALEAWATASTPAHEPERATRCDTQAGHLRAEGDVAAAVACWEEAEQRARREQPWRADEALEALARLAAEAADLPRLRRLCARAEAVQARPSTRIPLWGALGGAALDEGAPGSGREAQQALAAARRAFEQSARGEAREALRSGKAWLDLPLRRRLPEAAPAAAR